MVLLIIVLLLTIALFAYNNYAILKARSNTHDIDELLFEKIRHSTQASIVSMLSFYIFYLYFGDGITFKMVNYWLIFLSCFWIGFDLLLNRIWLEKIFYVGHTAYLDKLIRRLSKKVNIHPEIFGIILKIKLLTFLIFAKDIYEFIKKIILVFINLIDGIF